MPYKSYEELPDSVKDALPKSAADIFINAFNSAYAKYDGDETRSFKIAWGAVKNAGYEKVDGKWQKVSKQLDEGEEEFIKMCDEDVGLTFEVLKVNESDRLLYGWAVISSIHGEPYFDTDNEHIPEDVMMRAATKFMIDNRVSKDSHDNDKTVGMVVHSFPLTKEIATALGIYCDVQGWIVGVKVNDIIMNKFKTGEYRGFSIGGLAAMAEVDE